MSTIVVSCSRDPDAARHVVFALRRAGWHGEIELVRPWSRPCTARACGLLLAGGLDIEPHRWDTTATVASSEPIDPERDAVELALATAAWARGLPILGICRGAQLLSVARGGTLHADIASVSAADYAAHQHGHADDPSVRHDVHVRARSRLAGILGATRLAVNSRHHQAVRDPGDGLVAVAHEPDTMMPDGALVEAIEASDRERWVVGVQWHPENLVGRIDDAGTAALRLFAHFAAASAHRAIAIETDGLAERRDLAS